MRMSDLDSAGLPSPIAQLPVELLIEIFIRCAQDAQDDSLVILHVSEVCRTWRDITYGSPRMWQYLFLDDRNPQPRTQSHIRSWMENSGKLPLDITLHISDHDRLLPLIVPLFEHIHRWRRCMLTGVVQDEGDFSEYARLEELRVVVKDPGDLEVDTPLFLYKSPHRLTFRCSLFTIPPPYSMSAFHVTKLVITEWSLEGAMDPARMLEFLSFCRNLESFQYYGFITEPAYPEPVIHPPIVKLPSLRGLFIHSSSAVRTLLSHIDAPNLTTLHLEHTNTECDLASAPLYPYAWEEGDSEDEAGDFSQSPWSDHATGMGLRSLIRRSNPPLQVLAMDYADMRTKDFRWCFDRLKDLTDFRIVASDMSDRVFSLLAPYAPRGYGLHNRGNAGSGSDTESEEERALHVRLPKLSVLELCNCQRLSGEAIVRTLQARVRFTDRVADGTKIRRMEDIGIVACGGFTPAHGFELEDIVGARLRTA